MDASLRSAGQIGEAWMLRPAQHDQTDRVIPNAVRNPQTILCSNLPNQD